MSNSLFAAIEIGKLERVHAAILPGADVNGHQLIDDADYTPFLLAAEISRDPAIIKTLLDAGADVNGHLWRCSLRKFCLSLCCHRS